MSADTDGLSIRTKEQYSQTMNVFRSEKEMSSLSRSALFGCKDPNLDTLDASCSTG